MSFWDKLTATLRDAFADYPDFEEVIANAEQHAISEPTETRDTSMPNIYAQISDKFWDEEFENENGYHYLHDIFVDSNGGQMYAITSSAGSLYQWPVTVSNDLVELGEPVDVAVQFVPRSKPIYRKLEDGRILMVGVICTSILNRSGHIDSRAMFDTFVERFKGDGSEYVNFAHVAGAETSMGKIVRVWREGYALLAAMEFANDPISQAAAEAMIADEKGVWGFSIEFWPDAGPVPTEIHDGIKVPVYNAGALAGVSILKEKKAAAWFTQHIVSRSADMRKEDYADLVELVGPDLADDMLERVESLNKDVDTRGLIARSAEDAVGSAEEAIAEIADEEEVVAESVEEVEAEVVADEDPEAVAESAASPVFEIDDELVDVIAGRVAEGAELQARSSELFRSLIDKVQSLTAQVAELVERVAVVESEKEEISGVVKESAKAIEELSMTDNKKFKAWMQDLPKQPTPRAVYRPSQGKVVRDGASDDGDEQETVDLSAVAAKNISSILKTKR